MKDDSSKSQGGEGGGSTVRLSANATAFVPSHLLDGNDAGTVASQDPVSEVSNAVHALLNNPEEFYEVANHLAARLTESVKTDEAYASIVNLLFVECTNQNNFQYTGARLFAFLCEHLPQDMARSFRSRLMTRCKTEFERKEELVSSADCHAELINFTLFMGELMLNLTVGGEVIQIFPGSVLKLLSSVLSIRSDDSIKGFVQALKLTGATLEKHVQTELSELFQQIKNLIADNTTLPSQRELLLSVVILRSEQWRVVDDAAQASGDSGAMVDGNAAAAGDEYPAECYASSDEDDVLTGYNENDFEVVYDGDEPYFIPREMDPDMEEEYEKFVAENEARRLSNSATDKPDS